VRNRVLAFVMAGGRGERLDPLTRFRTKPAVPFGGRYRLIDFVLSNLVNSDITAINVLTQYKAQSVLEHVQYAWAHRVVGRDSYITVVPAQMQMGDNWYQGTADAVFQNVNRLHEYGPDIVAVFGADHIYKMNVRQMIEDHRRTGAQLTVACLRVPRDEASAFGVADVADNGLVRAFVEKPADPPGLPDDPDSSFASMGNYIFQADALIEALDADTADPESTHDFGRDIVPRMVAAGGVYAHDFSKNRIPGSRSEAERGYWRDVGTIESYYDANLDLKNVTPQLNLFNREWPIHSATFDDPPSKFVFDEPGRRGEVLQSVLSAGCIIAGGFAKDSILGRNVVLHAGADVRESIIMDNVEIGRDARIYRAIIDKNVVIPAGATVGGDPERDRALGVVSPTGIVVVPKVPAAYDFPYRT